MMSLHTDMSGKFSVSLCISGSNVREISIGNAQNRGARDYQEDSFGYTPLENASSEGFIAAVADGMGGLSAGDKVSAYAVSSILAMRMQANRSQPVHLQFRQVISVINREVVLGGSGGGCTFAALFCRDDGVYWCSVGDSRIYILRDNMLFQLSEDGDYQNRLLDDVIAESLDFGEMLEDKRKDSLTQYIGSKKEPEPDVNILPLIPRAGDRLLICSDGVYNALSVGEMARALSKPAQEAADALAAEILKRNYENQDNNTAVVLEFA